MSRLNFFGTFLHLNVDIHSTGSSVPIHYNYNVYSKKNYVIHKQDIFTSTFWQKASVSFVASKDGESAKKLKKKYKLL